MFKLKFKRRAQQAGPPFSDEYPEFVDPDYADAYNPHPGEYYQDIPHPHGYECLFCGNPISSAHLVVTTRQNEYYLHPGCILSGFALVLNGLGFLMKLITTSLDFHVSQLT